METKPSCVRGGWWRGIANVFPFRKRVYLTFPSNAWRNCNLRAHTDCQYVSPFHICAMARFSLTDAVTQTEAALRQTVSIGLRIIAAEDAESYTIVDGKPKIQRNGRVIIDINEDAGDQQVVATSDNTSAFWVLKVLRDNSGILLLVPTERAVTLQGVTLSRNKQQTQTRKARK